MKKQMLVLVVAAVFTLGVAQSQIITYVDAIADGGVGTVNTTETGGAALATWYSGSGSSASLDNQWARRTSGATTFGNGANDILQYHDPNVNSAPELRTTITGLSVGVTYDLYAFFWDADGGQTWTLDAGTTSGALTTFSADVDTVAGTTNAVAASTLTYSSAIATASDNRILYTASIGQVTIGAGGTVDIFIDNTLSDNTDSQRSWYDGVGYAAVPEPSTVALLVMGTAGVCLLRRRK